MLSRIWVIWIYLKKIERFPVPDRYLSAFSFYNTDAYIESITELHETNLYIYGLSQQKNGAEAPHFFSLNQDIVGRSQKVKLGLKYDIQIPGK